MDSVLLDWWSTPVIPALGRWRQEDHKCKVSLDYIAKLCRKEGREGGMMKGRKEEKKEVSC
jgi:hypothetical protein